MSANPDPVQRLLDRAATNLANAQHSTGPRTDAGKQRSSQNALSHGLTARAPVLRSEDPAAYERHLQQFRDEYHPASATESQLVRELADTAWRLNRIPRLEAELLSLDSSPQTSVPHLATLGLHSSRLSRQFQKTLATLLEIQTERRRREERDLARAAALLELHKHKGLPFEPADHGFVFSKDQIAAHSHRLTRLNQSRQFEHVLFHLPPRAFTAASTH